MRFFYIALRALYLDHQDNTGPSSSAFQAAGHRGQLYNTGDIKYADDLVSTSGTLAGLQRKADIISVFPVLFDMELSPAKLRHAMFGPGPPDPVSSGHPRPALVPHPRPPTHLRHDQNAGRDL